MYSRFYAIGEEDRGQFSVEANLCGKMLQDVLDGMELMQKFPDRVVFLYYEDLAENLHTRVKQLYSLLDMKYDRKLVDSLAEVVTNLAPPQLGIDFKQDRLRNNTIWWRKYMQWMDILRVDNACKHVYSKLGYKKLYHESQIRDLRYSTFSIPDIFKLPGIL